MNANKTLTSPRLIRLREELAEGKLTALDNFWQEIGLRGTPLVKPISGSDQSLVTFLWQAKDKNRNVPVVSNLSGRDGASEAMALLPGCVDLLEQVVGTFAHRHVAQDDLPIRGLDYRQTARSIDYSGHGLDRCLQDDAAVLRQRGWTVKTEVTFA